MCLTWYNDFSKIITFECFAENSLKLELQCANISGIDFLVLPHKVYNLEIAGLFTWIYHRHAVQMITSII
jgi:hypothetical protein